jgi:protein SCO1/2
MKRLPLIFLPVIVVLTLVAAGAIWRLGDLNPQSAAVTNGSAQDNFGGPFSLIDQDGRRRTEKDFRGKYMLIFFGYTWCPDICPTTLATEAEALDKLGPDANRIVPIFISVDPKRDKPEKLKTYLSSFDPTRASARNNFVGLTGTDEEIAKAANAYGVFYRAHLDGAVETGDEYSIEHSTDIYLMGPQGKFVAWYSSGILPDELAADLKRTASR